MTMNRPRQYADLRKLVDLLLQFIPRNYNADPDQLIKVEVLMEQIRFVARNYDDLDKEQLEGARGELVRRLIATNPAPEATHHLTKVWEKLMDPPHPTSCLCAPCMDDLAMRA